MFGLESELHIWIQYCRTLSHHITIDLALTTLLMHKYSEQIQILVLLVKETLGGIVVTILFVVDYVYYSKTINIWCITIKIFYLDVYMVSLKLVTQIGQIIILHFECTVCFITF
jgi:hypothetical protein